MFEKIIELSIKNKVILGFVLILVLLWGAFSLRQLPIDAIPDVTNNQVVILTQSPALATEEVEQYITAPLELQMANLQGVTEIRSTSRQGLSVITVVFEEDIDMYLARQMVAEQIKIAEGDIPQSLGSPELAPITTGLGEIYQYTLVPQKGSENKYSLTDLRTLQDWVVKRQLAGIEGVIEISSFGGFVKQYEIKVNPEKLKANGIGLSELYDALQSNNANIGGSYIEKNNQAYFIRGQGVVTSLVDIAQIAVSQKGGLPIRVKDVADLGFGHAIRYGAMTRNGESEAVGGIVLMLKGADSEKTIAAVKERISRISESLPEDIEISAFIDRTKLIDKSISTVEKNLIEGGLIVIFVLVMLMGSIRAGLLVASVIPITMLITFGIMNQAGISANLMSLGAMDFGLLVDCSVIVVEAVLFKLHHDDRFKVPKIEAGKMDNLVKHSASSVLSSAVFGGFIILLVYLPILSLEGIEGKMFRPMALTVSIAIMVAILLSLTYIPMASALLLRKEGNKYFKVSDRIVNSAYRVYEPVFSGAIRMKKLTVTIALLLLAAAVFTFTRMGGEFIPTLDEGDLAVDFQTAPGSSLTTTIDATLKAQKSLIRNFPEVRQIVGRVGASEVPTDPMPPEMSDLMINLKDPEEWTSADSREELVEKMAAVLEEEVPGTSVEFTQPIQMRFNEMISGAKSEIVVKIFGEDLNTLSDLGEKVNQALRDIEGVASVKVERVAGLPQIKVDYNRDALARYGLHIDELNTLLNSAFSGQTAGVVFEKEKRFDMVLRLDESFRKDIENVRQLPVKTASGAFVPFSALGDISYQTGPAQISREGTKRRINIGIGVLNRDVESLVGEIQKTLRSEIDLPTGYYFEYGGAFENLQMAKDRLMLAVPVALTLILVMLYFTFRSIKKSLIIFTAIPFSAIGGVFALYLRGMPFSISAGVGFIALFGVAVLNGMVLLGYLSDLEKDQTLNLTERVKTAVKARFRPVMMTASVASLGFLPMAVSTSAGAEVQKPLATVVIGGLISATLLTLVVLPVLYMLFNQDKKNSHLSKQIATIALIVLFPFFSNAQMSLDQILQKADQNNPGYQLKDMEIAISKQDVLTARSIPVTDFSFQYGNIQTPGANDYVLGVDQKFWNPAKNKSLKAYYETLVGVAEADKKLSRAALHKEVRQFYLALLNTSNEIKILEEQFKVYGDLLDFAQKRANAGAASEMYALMASNEMEALETQLSHKKVIYQSNLNGLKKILQMDSLEVDLESPLAPVSSGENPNLLLIQASEIVAKSTVEMEQAKMKPDFSLGLFNQSMLSRLNQFYVGAGIQIPIFRSAEKAKVESARLRHALAGEQYRVAEYEISKELMRLKSESEGLRNAESRYNAIIESSESVLSMAKKRYLAGEITFLEYHQPLLQQLNFRLSQQGLNHQYNLIQNEILWLQGQ